MKKKNKKESQPNRSFMTISDRLGLVFCVFCSYFFRIFLLMTRPSLMVSCSI